MNIYEKIFRAFEKAKIQYLIISGVAVNLYGYIRYTDDIDILLAPNEKNVLKALKVIKHFHHVRWSPPIDITLKPQNDFRRLFKKRNFFNIGDLKYQ